MVEWQEHLHPREHGKFSTKDIEAVSKEQRTRTTSALLRQKHAEGRARIATHLAEDPRPMHPMYSTDEHISMAEEMIDRHTTAFKAERDRLRDVVSPHAEVSGRVKDIDSAIEKLQRKPKEYKSVAEQTDTTGLRVMVDTVEQVDAEVARIKAAYEPFIDPKTGKPDENDYIRNPKDDYRSYHLIMKSRDGLPMEIQVRTRNQHQFAEWCHHLYKPETEEQKGVATSDETKTYRHALSEYFYKLDQHLPAAEPPVIPPTTALFGDPLKGYTPYGLLPAAGGP
jgi:ppGpp synthetase/RelA/SpoT-type nucleotidyltranferase